MRLFDVGKTFLFVGVFIFFPKQSFPENGSPTTINPCLTRIISYNYNVLSIKYYCGYKFSSFMVSFIAYNICLQSMLGKMIPGNRSDVIPINKGKSNAKNLAMFTSFMALNISMLSFSQINLLLRLPAAVSTDFTALIP